MSQTCPQEEAHRPCSQYQKNLRRKKFNGKTVEGDLVFSRRSRIIGCIPVILEKAFGVCLVGHRIPFGADVKNPNKGEPRLAEEGQEPNETIAFQGEEAVSKEREEKEEDGDVQGSMKRELQGNFFIER